MSQSVAHDRTEELDAFVAAFEAARGRDPAADPAAFLPGPGHALYREVLRELVRVDLEYGWTEGRPRPLGDYRARFPDLFAAPADVREIAFEEYRLRQQAGEDPEPSEYRRRFGVDTAGWPRLPAPVAATRHTRAFPDGRSDLAATARVDREPAPLPEAGGEFLGFRVVSELGRGSFGRVYLARQGELADRPVVLKVVRDARGESRTLARLQHPNVVPIHSVHRAGRFHAICMPYLGPVTLADLLARLRADGVLPASGKAVADTFKAGRSATRIGEGSSPPAGGAGVSVPDWAAPAGEPALKKLEGMSYVEAVLWVGARLADGLAHAHDRGILHLDLKPANVLLADDGQPMLLDFNLAKDLTLPPDAPEVFVGGTLPYMAPEHLRAFRDRTQDVDGRCDVYGLGVILFELLAGRHPFPVRPGSLTATLPRAVTDRLGPPPRLRDLNPAVSPAAEAVVRKCLEPDPGRRYPTAAALREDLERHLTHLPLRHAREPSVRERAHKWVRRHPRLASATGVGTLAGVLLVLLGSLLLVRSERLAAHEAAASYDRFRGEVREGQALFLDAPTGQAKPATIATALRRPLDRYKVLTDPDWQDSDRVRRLTPEAQDQLRGEVGELLFLLAALTRLEADADPSRRDALLESAVDLNSRAAACYPPDRVPAAVWHLRELLATQLGRPDDAAQAREQAAAAPWQTARDGAMLASLLAARGQFRSALPLWQRATAQEPRNVWAWAGLGGCCEALGRHGEAAAAYAACVALDPDHPGWHVRRGLAHYRGGEYDLAAADFDNAIALRPTQPEAHVNRALARLQAGRASEACDDLTRAVELGAADARVYLIRSRARRQAGDDAGAKADLAEGLRRDAADDSGWVARAVARVDGDTEQALADLDRALAANPRSPEALESKAHILADRLRLPAEAVAVLNRAVEFYPDDGRLRAARGVLMARDGRHDAALRDAEAALAADNSPPVRYRAAGVYALTGRKARAVELLREAINAGYGMDLLPADRDLTPLRGDPDYDRWLATARSLQPPAGPRTDR